MRMWILAGGVVLVAALAVVWLVEESSGLAERQRNESQRAIEHLDERLQAFESRLDELAMTRVRVEAGPDRASELLDRIRQLEQRLARLESALPSSKVAPTRIVDETASNDSASSLSSEGLIDQIGFLSEPDPADDERRQAERSAAIRELLERYPDHPRAARLLRDLFQTQVRSGDYAGALDLLDTLATDVGLATWQRNELAVNVYSSQADRVRVREVYQQIIEDPQAPEYATASARFFIAYSHYQQGQMEEARLGFQWILDRYGVDPPAEIRHTVGGARNYLEKIDSR